MVFQSPSEFKAAWTDHTNYYCLGAPNGGAISATSGPTNCYDSAGNSANSGSTTCSATYQICPSSCTGSGPTVTLRATHGSIYANAISATGEILDTSPVVIKSGLYDGSIAAQSVFDQTLMNANTKYNDTSKGDRIEIIQIGNVNARSSQSSRMIISPNEAYIQAGPWWITVFSSQMLLGLPEAHTGRLAPGFCPFRPEIDVTQLNQIQSLVLSYFSTIPSHFGYILSSQAQQPSSSFPSTSSGYLESKENSEDTLLRTNQNDQGDLFASEISISQNT